MTLSSIHGRAVELSLALQADGGWRGYSDQPTELQTPFLDPLSRECGQKWWISGHSSR